MLASAPTRLHTGLARLADLYPVDEIAAFEAARAVLADLMPVDAYYVALHHPDRQQLAFVVTIDESLVRTGSVSPVDDGPASRVVRTGSHLLLQGETLHTVRGSPFGNAARRTNSQLHVPMRAWTAAGDVPPIGVLSVQSYDAEAYRTEHIAFVRTVADHLGTLVEARRRVEAAKRESAELRRQNRVLQAQARDQSRLVADLFIQLLREFEQTEPGVDDGGENGMLRRALERLRQMAQTAIAHETPATLGVVAVNGFASSDGFAPGTGADELTERERAVLRQFPRRNEEIAKLLRIEVSTVRYHCKNIYRKLRVRSKAEAVELLARMIP